MPPKETTSADSKSDTLLLPSDLAALLPPITGHAIDEKDEKRQDTESKTATPSLTNPITRLLAICELEAKVATGNIRQFTDDRKNAWCSKCYLTLDEINFLIRGWMLKHNFFKLILVIMINAFSFTLSANSSANSTLWTSDNAAPAAAIFSLTGGAASDTSIQTQFQYFLDNNCTVAFPLQQAFGMFVFIRGHTVKVDATSAYNLCPVPAMTVAWQVYPLNLGGNLIFSPSHQCIAVTVDTINHTITATDQTPISVSVI